MTRMGSGRLWVSAALALALTGTAAAQKDAGKAATPAAPAGAKGAAGKAAAGPTAKPMPPPPPANVEVKAARADLLGTDVDKAAAAAQKLGTARGADALDALLDALALGLHPKVAAVALDSVGNFKSASSYDVLAYYARHRSPELRAHAIGALGKLDDKRAHAVVMTALSDGDKSVRAAACKVLQDQKDRSAAQPLMALLKKGDEAAAAALAAIATPEIARQVGELVGDAPDDLVARTLGLVLLRPDFGKEESYVEVVVALSRVPGDEAVVQLTNFISATPEKPPRLSRRRAQEVVDQRLGGGGGAQ